MWEKVGKCGKRIPEPSTLTQIPNLRPEIPSHMHLLGLGYLHLASVPASIAYLLGFLIASLYVYCLSIRDGTLLALSIWRAGLAGYQG